MKKIFSLILVVLLLVAYGAFALGSSSEGGSTDQGHDSASSEATKGNLGDYNVDILSCRVVSDYEGDPVVIVKYKFTNYDDDAAAFYIAISDKVYQNEYYLSHKEEVVYHQTNCNADSKQTFSIVFNKFVKRHQKQREKRHSVVEMVEENVVYRKSRKSIQKCTYQRRIFVFHKSRYKSVRCKRHYTEF